MDIPKVQDDKPKPIDIREAEGETEQYYEKEGFGKRNFFGKLGYGLKKAGQFAWKHKKKVLTIAGCAGAGSYLAPAGTIISLITGTGARMEFLGELPGIVSLAIAIGGVIFGAWQKSKKDGLLSTAKAVGSRLDEALEAYQEAGTKDSPGGRDRTKAEWARIAKKMNVSVKDAKKRIDSV